MTSPSYSSITGFTSKIMTVLRTVVAVAATMVLLLWALEPVQAAYNVNVNVNVNNVLATMPATGIGNNISVYDHNVNNSLTWQALSDAGVQLIRYPGGSYSDLYHWSTKSAVAGGYVHPGTDFGVFADVWTPREPTAWSL